MGFFKGIAYNWKGLKLGLKTPALLALGLVRFAVALILTVACAAIVVIYYREVTAMIWSLPESPWISWLWHLLSWLIALLMFGGSTVVAFLLSQVLFSVMIMDAMSRKTETLVSGGERLPERMSTFRYFATLLRQEIPRAVLPVSLAMGLLVLGWVTPLSPITTLLSSGVAAVFLAWDNTDLVSARRMEPFKERFWFLLKTLPMHLGFGLWFLIPGVNMLFLSFAPVGGTLVRLEWEKTPTGA
jgi:CysZ protein